MHFRLYSFDNGVYTHIAVVIFWSAVILPSNYSGLDFKLVETQKDGLALGPPWMPGRPSLGETLLHWPPGVPRSPLSAQTLPSPEGCLLLPGSEWKLYVLCSGSIPGRPRLSCLCSPLPSTWALDVGSVGSGLWNVPPGIPLFGVPSAASF